MRFKRKISCISLAILCAIGVLPIHVSQVHAVGISYPMNCSGSEFEVALAQVDANKKSYFEKLSCHVSFVVAKKKMKTLDKDKAVIRHASMDSGNKIMAMNSGLVYTDVDSSTVVPLYMAENGRNITYARTNRMAFYHDTLNYNKGRGDVLLTMSGFKGTTDIHYLEFVPMAWMDNGSLSYVNGKTTHKTTPYFSARSTNGRKEIYFTAFDQVGKQYFWAPFGLAPSWMKEGIRYYSANDIDYYYDTKLTKKAGTYYNYYQFLPLRTKSKIPASKYNDFLGKQGYNKSSKLWDMGKTFVSAQEHFGLNALMIFAQACVESGYGTSYIARKKNNLFGWKAYDSNPNNASGYRSVEQSINQAFRDNIRDYVSTNEPVYHGEHFGNKGSGITMKYASSTTYGLTIASVAYAFDKYAGLVDYNNGQFAVLKNKNVNMYHQPKAKANVLYKAGYGMDNRSPYYNNHVVTVLGVSGDYYKIQSTDYHDGSKVITSRNNHSDRAYDWNKMVAYVKRTDLTLISNNRGWKNLYGNRYWFNEDGRAETGWRVIDGYRYWFFPDGRMETGWAVIAGEKYHFAPDGKLDTGWFEKDGKKYYLDKSGNRVKGLHRIENKIYYFDENGFMKKDGWNTIQGSKYWLNPDGHAETGWRKIGTHLYWFFPDGRMETGWALISGHKYHFAKDGKMDIGWLQYNGYQYYLDEKGRVVTGYVQIDKKTYYFESSGVLLKNGWNKVNGENYWLNKEGKVEPGWKTIDDNRYWFNTDGRAETGWLKLGNYLYWFFPDGRMETGWAEINGKIYHFGKDGKMDTGWFTYNGKKYNLGKDGVLQKSKN
ncbi:glucosaminidase domain-containing protein [Bulleidia sp. zg-1013]|uniref:glucosaminidase domain-containing protein n=1 Tax=Bacillati TaxID=1783272 RepID=UPI001C6ED943|nr:glucosaminidase domain-containing protein [Trueperella sp. zg.1013]